MVVGHNGRYKNGTLSKVSRLLVKILRNLFWVLLCVFIVRNSLLEIYNVPSDSMKNALRPGDYLIVNRIFYSGLISKMFSLFNVKGNLSNNDIVVFKLDINNKPIVYVKRCIGLPGQTISIKHGITFIDDQLVEEAMSVRHLYKLWYNDRKALQSSLEEWKIDPFENVVQKSSKYFISYLDHAQLGQLKNAAGIDSVTAFAFQQDNVDFVSDPLKYGNERQNMESFTIPFQGMKIALDTSSFKLYKDVIGKYEQVKIEQKGNTVYINDSPEQNYAFKNDYYFVMGDNRANSIDSRSYGIIARESLQGKVIFKL